MNESISVVIPTFNRGKTLLEVLPSYLSQQYVKEIIIVDDVSDDNTERIITEFALKNKKVRYIRNSKRMGGCVAKNIGIQQATGSYIFIGEDDLELTDNFLKILIEHLKKEGADIIAGRRIWMHEGESKHEGLIRANKINKYFIKKLLITDFHGISNDDVQSYLLDASMLIKKEVTNHLLFDCMLFKDFVSWRNESSFQLSAIEKGYKLIFCPHVYSFHRPKKALRLKNIFQTIKYDYYVFKNNYLFLKKHENFINNQLNINSFIFLIQFGLHRIMNRYFLPFSIEVKSHFFNLRVSNNKATQRNKLIL